MWDGVFQLREIEKHGEQYQISPQCEARRILKMLCDAANLIRPPTDANKKFKSELTRRWPPITAVKISPVAGRAALILPRKLDGFWCLAY